ncbi:MAG: 30S ribosomal protein S12 methylthiotransferase RimO [Verrucomicrobiia bacterium]
MNSRPDQARAFITEPHAGAEAAPAVGIVSLGCAKNLVDGEIMLGSILKEGMRIVSDPDQADVIIVNTCAFIDPAKEESIEAILQAHQDRGLRKQSDQRLIVSGCMSQRFSKELTSELPEVDAFMGLDQIAEAGRIVREVLERPPAAHPRGGGSPLDLVTGSPRFIPDYDTPRYRLTPAHFAYVKIAEGCNHPCTFCVIPRMRGRHRSRTIASVVEEVRRLVAEGVKEFNLISQDTTYFGMDLWAEKAGPRTRVDSTRGPTLIDLIEALEKIEGDFWVRLLYTHPAHWSRDLMQAIRDSSKVVRYVDMPLQHIHSEMLSLMRRETSREHIEILIEDLRQTIPGLTLRTTFIVGFPGETQAHFESLLEFIEKTRFERLGIFCYSKEEESRAAKMPGHLSKSVKNRRYREAMTVQKRIACEIAKASVGREMRVLVESPSVARSEGDAPDVDCRVLLETPATVGQFAMVRITASKGYDTEGRVVQNRGQ